MQRLVSLRMVELRYCALTAGFKVSLMRSQDVQIYLLIWTYTVHPVIATRWAGTLRNAKTMLMTMVRTLFPSARDRSGDGIHSVDLSAQIQDSTLIPRRCHSRVEYLRVYDTCRMKSDVSHGSAKCTEPAW
jgi:hypothetical protein